MRQKTYMQVSICKTGQKYKYFLTIRFEADVDSYKSKKKKLFCDIIVKTTIKITPA